MNLLETLKQKDITPYQRRRTAAELLAITFLQIFPDAQLMDIEVTDIDFAVLFRVMQKVEETLLPTIERKTLDLIKANEELDYMEMTPGNAGDYLESLGQELIAERTRSCRDSLCHLLRIGDQAIPAPFQAIRSAGEVGAFKLVGVDASDGHIAIVGMAEVNQKELRRAVKRIQTGEKRNHQNRAIESFLAGQITTPAGEVWFLSSRGLHSLSQIRLWWRILQENRGFLETSISGVHDDAVDDLALLTVKGTAWTAWESEVLSVGNTTGLLDFGREEGDISVSRFKIDKLQKKIEESLSVFKTVCDHFGFQAKAVYQPVTLTVENRQVSWKPPAKALLSAAKKCGWVVEEQSSEEGVIGPLLSIKISDAMGVGWEMMELEVRQGSDKDEWVVAETLIMSATRLLGLLLERESPNLPLFFDPSPIQIVVHSEEEKALAMRLRHMFLGIGPDAAVVSGGGRSDAENKQIPYTIILSDQTLADGSFSLQRFGSESVEVKEVEDLIKEVRAEWLSSVPIIGQE